ncbi:AAWKG family protein [Streptomyces polygonati]|uniref:AAWKG family protein n=1 Tax=Streptomyces polygonati TaxID=1617087 RepID=A0ABV8HR10_9ACTN
MAANTYDADDYFGKAVSLFTGYPMPSRKTLFDKLKSKEGIPLFRMDIQTEAVRAVTADDFSALSGWMKHDGEDYDLVFYTAGGDGRHDYASLTMHRARIVFIGVPVDGNGRARLLGGGELSSGGPFTGHYGDEWDSGPMSQYISGSKVAIDTLLSSGTTQGVSYSGASVADADAVDLKSFDRTAMAFDRAKKFFADHANTLKGWQQSLGTEQASWRGEAAGLFWHLIDQLHKNYDSYVTQLGGLNFTSTHTSRFGYTPTSKLGDSVVQAQSQLATQAVNLQSGWTTWAANGEQDPHRALLEELDKLSAWVLQNNIPYVMVTSTGDGDSYSTTAQFKETVDAPGYGGSINDIGTTWKTVGLNAVTQWNTYLDNALKLVSQTAISDLGNHWGTIADDFDSPLETKNTESLTQFLQSDELDVQNDQANQNQNNLNDALNNLNNGLNDNLNNLGNNLNNLGDNLGNNLNSLNNLGNDLGSDLGNSLNDLLGGPGGGDPSDLNPDLGALSNLNNLSDLNGPGGGPNDPGGNLGDLTPSGLNPNLGDLTGPLSNPGGSVTALNPDGSLTTTYPDGSTSTFNPATGQFTTTSPGGKTTTKNLNPGDTVTNPDGSTTTLNADGTLTTKFPDGTVTTVNPVTGATTTTHPDGTVTSSQLNPGASDPFTGLNDLGDLGNLGNLNNGLSNLQHQLTTLHVPDLPTGFPHPLDTVSAGPGALNTLATEGGPAAITPFDTYDNPLSTDGALGSPSALLEGAAATAGPASGATPLNPMGGGMGGMGGGGTGGGQGGGSGERVRNVLTDGDGTARARRRPRTSASAEDEAEMVLPRGIATTGSGGRGRGDRERPATESAAQPVRASWVAEEEDVWGSEEGGAPAVIG